MIGARSAHTSFTRHSCAAPNLLMSNSATSRSRSRSERGSWKNPLGRFRSNGYLPAASFGIGLER